MITEKELIRRALLGDKQAQEECTAKGIALPCPFCGGKATMQQDITGRESYHVACSNVKDMCNLIAGLPMWSESEEDALKSWNTRPAPPIGRCGECRHCVGVGKNQALRCTLNSFGVEFGLDFITSESFCSYFEPREESR